MNINVGCLRYFVLIIKVKSILHPIACGPVCTLNKTLVAHFYFPQAYYITTARELARMVGIRKAPVLHHFSESTAGAATIRCFSQEDRFLTQILSLIDDYSRVAFYNSATMEWLCVRINFLFNLVFFLVLIILVGLPRSAVDPSKFFLSLLLTK